MDDDLYITGHSVAVELEMKKITVSVDEETYRLARIRAAELGTSVSALVRDYLKSLVADRAGGTADNGPVTEPEAERRRRMLNEAIEKIRTTSPGFRAADNLPREELYDRASCQSRSSGSGRRRRRPQARVSAVRFVDTTILTR